MAAIDNPFVAFNFLVQLDVTGPAGAGLGSPLCDCAFAECDGLEMTMEPKVVREGGNNLLQIHLAGPVSYSNLTLKRGMTANLDLWKWFAAVAGSAGRGPKATGTISVLDAQGWSSGARGQNVKVAFVLTGCLPIKIKAPALNAKDGQVAIEELQIAYDSLEVRPG